MAAFDFNRHPEFDGSGYDVVIAGAGAAGLYLASKLSRTRRVLVLESGHFAEDEDRQRLNEVVQTGKPMQAAVWRRKRAVGGTTVAWGGQSLPFLRSDFEEREWVERAGWPINLDDLAPHYRAANRVIGIDELDYDNEAFNHLGYAPPAFDPDIVHLHVSKWTPEPNFRKVFAEDAALNVLAQVAPAWLSERVGAEWLERYGERFSDYRLPKAEGDRLDLSELVGRDGMALLDAVFSPEAPDYLRAVPTVDVLRRVWVQHFYMDADVGRLRWREQKSFPPSALMVASPYDLDVRYSQKRGTEWKGFKVHLTETCEPDRPNLITHVATTAATDQDVTALDDIHDGLDARGLLPKTHLADGAYLSAFELVKGRRRGVEVVGPMRVDTSWQAADPDAFELARFDVDWEAEQVTCPEGERSYKWSPSKGPSGKPTLQVSFPKRACSACEARPRCTKSASSPRTLTLHPQAEHEALVAAREHQKTETFKERYKARSGVEGTVSEAAFALGARRARYRGLAKTHLQLVATGAAMNLKRVVAWLDGVPRSGTRVSHFARLAVAA